MKKVTVFIGNFGSGKTELALNLAINNAQSAVLVDLDIINPYFRSAERKDILDAAGVKLLHPIFALTTVDVPSLPPDIYSVFIDNHENVFFDVGGDPAGATALGQYKENFDALPDGCLNVLFVINPRRPFSATPKLVIELLDAIQKRARLKITGLVNNSNLARETTILEMIDGYDSVKEVSLKTGIPVKYTSGIKNVLDEFEFYAKENGLSNEFIGELLPITPYMHRDWETFTQKGI